VERPKNDKEFTKNQQAVKQFLNEQFGKKVFHSINAPAKNTEEYLQSFREALSKPDVFDTTSYRIFQRIGRINQKGFLKCLEALELNQPLRSGLLDKAVDQIIVRSPLKYEMQAAEVACDHIVNIEWALARMQENPLDRDLSWLYNPDVSDDELQSRWQDVERYAIEEFERLKHRYFMPSISPGVEAETLNRNELAIFSKLLKPGHYTAQWDDLHDYPEDAIQRKVDISELYIAAQDFGKGKLTDAIRSPYSGRRKLMAKVMGIVLYLEYLKNELPEEKTDPQQPQVVQNVHNDYRTIIDGLHLTQVNAMLVKSESHHTENNLTIKTEPVIAPLTKEEQKPTADLRLPLKPDGRSEKQLEEDIASAWRKLKENGYLHPNTKIESFKSIFMPSATLIKGTRWNSNYKTLRYFIFRLVGRDFKVKIKNGEPKYQVVKTFKHKSVLSTDVDPEWLLSERVSNCFIAKRGGKANADTFINDNTPGELKQRTMDQLDLATDYLRGIHRK
jgi:hypothetical protein